MPSETEKKAQNYERKAPKVSLREMLDWYGLKKAIIFPLLALFFIIIILIYHSLLMNYARRSIVEGGKLSAGRLSEGVLMYISSARDTLERSSYILDDLLAKGEPHDEIVSFLTEETKVLNNTDIVDTSGLYAYIHGQYHDGFGWNPEPDYDPTTRPWYTQAVKADGEMVLVNPYIDVYSGDIVMTLAERLSDGKSVIALDIKLGEIQEIIESYGNPYANMVNFVVGGNGMVVAHTSPAEIGKNYLEETGTLGNAVLTEVLKRDERSIDLQFNRRNYTVYDIPISSGWHCISVADSDVIYRPINLLILLCVLVIVATIVVFIIIMFRTWKREAESRHLETLLKSTVGLYLSVCDFDLERNTVTEVTNDMYVMSEFESTDEKDAIGALAEVMHNLPESPAKQAAIEFADLKTIDERMADTDYATIEYLGYGDMWVRCRLIVSERNRSGKIRRVLWMIENITHEKEEREHLIDMSERAIAASEAKSAFLSNMSHEIRTPINAVLGMNEMIIRESNEPKIVSYAKNIKGAGNSLLGIINDILDFSKIESGKVEIAAVDYDLTEVLNDLINMVKIRTDAKNLDLICDIDPETPVNLIGDDVRIRQIITNILTNAAKYTNEGSVTFSVSFRNAGQNNIYLLVAVKDTGIGIRQEDMSKLFANFERIDDKRIRNIEGTGLGIAITQSLLELMDSNLEVESTYNVGSTFSFRLRQGVKDRTPIGDYKQAFEKLAQRERRYVPKFKAPHASALVVDDMMVNLVVLKGLLGKTGMSIDIADSGMRAIELAGRTKYNIIFLDHMMPGMDGVETLERIRADEANPNHDSVFISLTANAIAGAREFYLEKGFDDYLSKPIDSTALEEMVYRYLPDELIEECTNIT
ncbi:MAG: response regulator [Lachnospiraceae bacterium]|nr:response regulator [Lachnospiraceae bacterium]